MPAPKNDITAERVRELLDYDSTTGVFTNRTRRGSRAAKGSVTGSIDAYGYLVIGIDGSCYKAHRLAWLYVHGEFPPNELDHINGRRDENMIYNLRPCTRAENNQNCWATPGMESGLMGARCRHGKWSAQIHANGRKRHIGTYPTPEAAHAAYLAAKAALHTFQPIPRQPLEMTP